VRHTEEDRVTEMVHADAPTAPALEDSGDPTIIERMQPLPMHAPPMHAPPTHAPPMHASAPRPVAQRSAPLPGWVLPYIIACLVLVLVGAFVLWTQSRVVGHF